MQTGSTKTRAEELAALLESGWSSDTSPDEMIQAAAELRRLAVVEAERDRLSDDNFNLRTTMVAAAEEISAHWQSYCDADGYGPANLLRRLECGIPSEYGYTAGAWAELKAERNRLAAEVEALRADAERYRWLRANALAIDAVADPDNLVQVWYGTDPAHCATGRTLDAAIDAAINASRGNG